MQDEDQPPIRTKENDINEISDLLKGLKIQFNKCFEKLDQVYNIHSTDSNENNEAKEENENQVQDNEVNSSTLKLLELNEKKNTTNDVEKCEKDNGNKNKHDAKTCSPHEVRCDGTEEEQTKSDIEENVLGKDEEQNLVDSDENRINIDETPEVGKKCENEGEQSPKQKVQVKYGYKPSPEHRNHYWQLKHPTLVELVPSSGIFINKKDYKICKKVSGDVPRFIEHLVNAIFKPTNQDVNNSTWYLRYAGVTELVPQSNIFVSKKDFDSFKKFTGDWEKLVGDVMEAIFTDEALAVCSLTGRKSNRYSYSEEIYESPALNKEAYKTLVIFINNFRKKQGMGDLNKINKIILKKLNKCKSKNKK